MTLDFFEQFRDNLKRLADRNALQVLSGDRRESFSYRQVGEEIAGVARFLKESGVEPGQSVGILMENHPRWGIAFLAAQSAGAVVVPFDIQHHAETLAKLVRHSECRLLLVSEKQLPVLGKIQNLLPEPLPVLVAGDSEEDYPKWDSVLERQPDADPQLPLVERALDDPLVIIYTSGTTGDPKGVVLTQRNIFRNVVELLKLIRADSDDHILSVLPLYHVLALMVNFIIPLYAGAQVTYLDVLEAQKILKAFRDEGITIFVCIPQFYYLVHRRIFQEIDRQPFLRRFLARRLLRTSRFCNRRLGLNAGKLFFKTIHRQFGSRMKLFGVGGARFDSEIAASFRDLGFPMAQAYGMTETAALATLNLPGSREFDSVGRPLPHVQIRIEIPDENGVGEVLIRGENVMKGYLRNAEATREAVQDDWLHSGDLGRLSPAGFLYITGRQKDVIVLSSGKNIFPEEIEEAYQSAIPIIKEMCVLGVPDKSSSEAQEILHAVIVPDFEALKEREVVNASDMIRYLMENASQQLPPHKRVRSFEVRPDPLPRTTTRKIKRFEVQQELQERPTEAGPGRFKESTAAESEVEETVQALIRKVKPDSVVHRDMNLELDLGFDSLGRLEFLSNVQERFGVHIDDEAALRILTVGDLVRTLEERTSEGGGEPSDAKHSWKEILNRPLRPDDEKMVRERLSSSPFSELLYFLTAKFVYVLFRVLLRQRVEGLDNLPKEYPFLVCPNHLSYLDVFVLISPLPFRIIRRLFSLGYADYFRSGLLAFLGRLVKVIPVNADRHLRQALRLGAEGLRRDLVLCVFPEGERSISGELRPFKKGPAILAVELQVPVVPAAISGTYEVWRRGSSRLRLHPVQVRYGAPIRPEKGESYEDFNQRLFEAVEKLLEPSNHKAHKGHKD